MSPVERPGREQIEVGFVKLLGLRIEEASGDRVVLRCPVTADLHQPYGLVHGGVHATLAETAASVGGALWFADRGKVVGISNHTDFLRAVRGGELRAEATPLARGRTTQLWQVRIGDDQGRLVAHAKVRLQNVSEAPGAGTPGA
jgi:1,4-dihydroxy-2-naphthoyl-CoA hydrolase